MDDKDKKEVVKMMGEILEDNLLPAIEVLIENSKIELKKDINDIDEKLTRVERKLDENIIRLDDKLENHEKRIGVLAGKKQA